MFRSFQTKTTEGLLPNVDAVETVRNYVRVNGRELLAELYRNEMADSAFFTWARDRLSLMVREFMTVLSSCFSDGYEGVDRFLRAHLVSLRFSNFNLIVSILKSHFNVSIGSFPSRNLLNYFIQYYLLVKC